MINFIRKPAVFVFLAAATGIVAIFLLGNREAGPSYDFVVAQKGALVQQVSVTGRVKPAESVDLAFEKGGKVARVAAEVGNRVQAGEVLVALENSELAAQLAEAEAGVESAEAQLLQYEAALESEAAELAELKKGTRPEEIQVQEVKVANAKSALRDAETNLVDTLQDAYTKADDAVRNKIDQMYTDPESANPKLLLSVNNPQLKTDLEWERFVTEGALQSWKASLDLLPVNGDIHEDAKLAQDNLSQIKAFLDKTALAVNTAQSTATVESWRADVSTARVNVNAAVTNVTSAEEKFTAAEAALSLEENQLFLLQAGTIEERIASQEAQVRQAEANIASQEAKVRQAKAAAQNIEAQIAKTVLEAPIKGVVTKQDAKVGEIIASNAVMVSLISEAEFEVEAFIPEVDIAKVKIGDAATLTVDAYGGDEIFEAVVAAIDPAETIREGVPTYKTTLQFTGEDERIKSGMTADLDILTNRLDGVISVPLRAVITKNGEKIVRLLGDNNDVEEVKVETGIRGSDGTVEITAGVNEGDKVIIFVEAR